MSTPAPRVLLVTERTDVRRQAAAALADLGCAVLAEPPDGDLAAIAAIFVPDVSVLDLELIGQDARWGPVIVLPRADSTATELATVWRAGALDVVPDGSDVHDVIRRVTHALGLGSADELGLDDIVIDVAGHVVHRRGHPIELTATEFRLLVALVTNRHIVVSKPQLLRAVWGFDDYDVNLVEVHVSALRRKLESHGDRVIHTVRGIGYVARPPARHFSMLGRSTLAAHAVGVVR